MSNDPLPLLLRALRLPTMAEAYAPAIAAAEAENWGYRRFLTHLAEAETSDRTTRRIQRMLDDSGLPSGKTLASRPPDVAGNGPSNSARRKYGMPVPSRPR